MHDRDDRNPGRRQARHVGEGRAAAHEHFRLQHQVGPGAFHQLDVGQLLGERDLLRADRLLDPHRMRRAALDPKSLAATRQRTPETKPIPAIRPPP